MSVICSIGYPTCGHSVSSCTMCDHGYFVLVGQILCSYFTQIWTMCSEEYVHSMWVVALCSVLCLFIILFDGMCFVIEYLSFVLYVWLRCPFLPLHIHGCLRLNFFCWLSMWGIFSSICLHLLLPDVILSTHPFYFTSLKMTTCLVETCGRTLSIYINFSVLVCMFVSQFSSCILLVSSKFLSAYFFLCCPHI